MYVANVTFIFFVLTPGFSACSVYGDLSVKLDFVFMLLFQKHFLNKGLLFLNADFKGTTHTSRSTDNITRILQPVYVRIQVCCRLFHCEDWSSGVSKSSGAQPVIMWCHCPKNGNKSQQTTMKPLGLIVVIAVRWDKPQAANVEGCKLMPVSEV
jgi:hypothetical protein